MSSQMNKTSLGYDIVSFTKNRIYAEVFSCKLDYNIALKCQTKQCVTIILKFWL